MKCPICKKQVAAGEPEAPFCSERCRLVDLGNWSSGKYAIPGPSVQEQKQTEEAADDDEV